MTKDDKLETLKNVIRRDAVKIEEDGFLLASGKRSKLYIDLRKVTQDPEGINLVGDVVLDKIREVAPTARYVGGLETASIPISTAVSLLSFRGGTSLKAFWIRKKLKDHGMKNKVEGNLSNDGDVVILDDTVTTGGSSMLAVQAAREIGANVIHAIAIVDRGARGTFERENIPFFAFFSESDFSSKE